MQNAQILKVFLRKFETPEVVCTILQQYLPKQLKPNISDRNSLSKTLYNKPIASNTIMNHTMLCTVMSLSNLTHYFSSSCIIMHYNLEQGHPDAEGLPLIMHPHYFKPHSLTRLSPLTFGRSVTARKVY